MHTRPSTPFTKHAQKALIFLACISMSLIPYKNIHSLALTEVTLEQYLRLILQKNPEIDEAQAGVHEKQGMLKGIDDAVWPEITITAIGMPTPAMQGNAVNSDTSYKKWGPFFRSDISLIQPLHSFGRFKHGREAVVNAIEVEHATTKKVKGEVILRSKELFYTYLLAYSSYHNIILPTEELLTTAIDKAEEQYDLGTGTVSKADLGRLHVAKGELLSKKAQAEKALQLTHSALKGFLNYHTLESFSIQNKEIKQEAAQVKNLEEYIQLAFQHNPQYKQLQHGIQAREALIRYQKSNRYPVLFMLGKFTAAWAPHNTKQKSVFANDPFNSLQGYVGAGIKWDFNMSRSGPIKQAEAEYEKLIHKRRFSQDGIPLLIEKNYRDIEETQKLVGITHEAYKQALSWMAFAFLAFQSGTGPAKDALEGLGAKALLHFRYYESIFQYNMALARMSEAVGREVSSLEYEPHEES